MFLLSSFSLLSLDVNSSKAEIVVYLDLKKKFQ